MLLSCAIPTDPTQKTPHSTHLQLLQMNDSAAASGGSALKMPASRRKLAKEENDDVSIRDLDDTKIEVRSLSAVSRCHKRSHAT